ncbi:mucoidy inhibitor MuiA family protein [Bradyrhizobium ontarionense]|uniref:Mucoidy inhibitor MuiA family protein n=1 Tax=Bradyrhizobium ontarionense TaxID=2898149 RepID=A0ABY3RQ17_9BRAD|nr:mucoidy inhibitor MuiA family protein [Bradyrhizobium sp. A19]UFZ08583.1 mucoidy inhibitor MuiA family protein [Bradyrhizobium sp. A19]
MRKMGLVTTGLMLGAALTTASGHAANLDATSIVDAVTVYPDGATVTRVIALDLPAGETTAIAKDFPLGLDASSLRVEGDAGARLVIGTVDAKPPRAAPPVNLPEIDKRIEALKDERANLDGTIAAALARKKFAERFAEASPAGLGEKGEARPIAEWRNAFAAVAEEVGQADSAVRDAERKQREIDREIARLQADRGTKPPSRMEVQIELSAAAATKATLRVTYAVRNARWVPLYDARLDTSAKDRKPALELVRRAEIQQSTGEDWSDVALSVSTVRTGRGGSAPELRTVIAQYPPPPSPPMAQLGTLSDKAPRQRSMEPYAPVAAAPEAGKRAEERETSVEISAYQTAFRLPGRVSVGANDGAKSLRISTAMITPELIIRSAPVVDPTAYLEANFTQAEDTPLLPGKVSIYRDGMFVGTSRLPAAGKEEAVRLGFGADDKVKVERSVVKRNEGSAGLIVTTARIDERAFKTTIRNAHDFPVKVAIQDQLPVSENEEIVVEMLPATTPPTSTNVRDRRGVIEWMVDAKPGETKDISFAWRARWPKDKTIVMQPSG